MKTVKAGKPLLELIKLCYHADRPILLVGKHGVGKSELSEQAARDLGVGFICRDLSLMEPPDLIGLPKMEQGMTYYYPPSFLPRDGKGILSFEELNRCPSYMRAPCLQLLTARQLNDYTLPKGWLPMASINPEEEGYDVQSLDPALLARFVKVQIVPDKREWLAWAQSADIHTDVISYVERDPKIFLDTNPRDWSATSKILQTSERIKVSPTTVQTAIAGLHGRERASAFDAFRKGTQALPTLAEVLKNFGIHHKRLMECLNQGRVDVFEDFAYSAKVLLQNEDNYTKLRNNPAEWTSLGKLLKLIPPDLRQDLVNFMGGRRYEIPI